MNSEDPDRPLSEADVVSVTWLFEQVAIRENQQVDRAGIRRILSEASSYAQPQLGGWPRWIVETGHSLGRKSRVVEGEILEMIRLAQDGAIVILRSPQSGAWHSLTAGKGRRIQHSMPRGVQHVQHLSARRILRRLKKQGFEGNLRCVVMEPNLKSAVSTEGPTGGKRPTDRLMALLRTESQDLWIVAVFALVSGLLGMTTPLAVEALVNTVAFGRFLQPVIILSLMVLAFLIFQAALMGLQTFVTEIIQRRLFARVAADLSFRLPTTRLEAMDGQYSPELVNRFFDIVTVQKSIAGLLLEGISLVLNAVVGMTVLAFYHPYLLAFDMVLLLLLPFTVFVLGRGAVKTSIKESKTKYSMAAWLEDLARCQTAFRYDGAVEFALGRADRLIFDYLSARKKHFQIHMRQVIFMLLTQAVAGTAVLAIGGWLVISGQLSLGQLVAAELIVAVVLGSFAKLGKHMESFYDLMAAVDKLGVLLDLPLERQDGLLLFPIDPTHGIETNGLSYALPDGREVLRNVTLAILPGEQVALSGVSGSGKSLLLDMLFGLREPKSGQVTIFGVAPGDLRPDVLRRRVALARDIEIFHGTIAENVHLERPEIGIGDVRSALEVVGLRRLIQRLPDGLETALGPCGTPLTASQLQRLMIARAIAGRPDILLIDEVLDTLADEESAPILQHILESDEKGTIVLVSNRHHLTSMMERTIRLSPSPDTSLRTRQNEIEPDQTEQAGDRSDG